MSMMEYQNFMASLADAAGHVLRRYFRSPFAGEKKTDNSPVTRADREAESAMRTLIEQRYPDHGIFGEEHDRVRPHAEYQWVLDPIDGTHAFICGVPTFTTLISLVKNGAPVLGMVNQPILGER